MTHAIKHWRTEMGAQTRKEILRKAVEVASTDGLEGLTVGSLAAALGMSKSGLFAHFGSKEELQLATVEHARDAFVEAVAGPAFGAPEGLPRLWALCDRWLTHAASESQRGGCFWSGASAEFDGRPGAVRDRIAAIMQEWLAALEGAIAAAQKLGHLDRNADAKQLAFELHALEMGADWAFQLFGDREAPGRARHGIELRLRQLASPDAPGLPAAAPGRRKAKATSSWSR
jgi:AcrR family transcriptional regulator